MTIAIKNIYQQNTEYTNRDRHSTQLQQLLQFIPTQHAAYFQSEQLAFQKMSHTGLLNGSNEDVVVTL